MSRSRRSVLASAGGLAIAAVGGCLSEPPGTGDDADHGYAAFFALRDWAEQVSGDELSFEDPVDVGTQGHGWEPPPGLPAEVAQSLAFVYLDTPAFAWARDLAAVLERDHEDVALIDGMAGLEPHLVSADGSTDGSVHEPADDHGSSEHPASEDPHVWVDPVLAGEIVGTIADGLVERAPAGEATYRENADAYLARLDELDRQFETLADEATRELAIFAGHDSFRYLQARYGFEIHTPVGVSADEVETGEDITELIDLVETHDVDTVLYDPFETAEPGAEPAMVDVLLDDTDVTAAEPLTSVEGTTEEWTAAGLGYAEQMAEINLPSLRRALGAT